MATKKEKTAPKTKKAAKVKEPVVEETQPVTQEVKVRGWWTLEDFKNKEK
jgi:hypothetical protein